MAASEGFLKPVLIAVVVAIIGGGSAPWWLQYFRPAPQQSLVVNTTTQPTGNAQPPTRHNFPIVFPMLTHMGILEIGMNRNGGDILPSKEVANVAECSTLCLDTANCLAMTYVMHPNSVGGVCWLKSSVPNETPASGMTSAVKVKGG